MFVLYFCHLIGTLLFYGDLPPKSNENENLVRSIALDGSLVAHYSYGIGDNGLGDNGLGDNELGDNGHQKQEEEGMEEERTKGDSFLPSNARSVNGEVVLRNRTKDNETNRNGCVTSQTNNSIKIVASPGSPSRGTISVSPPPPTRTMTEDNNKFKALRFLLNDHFLCLLFGDFSAWFSMMAVLTISFPFGVT